MVFPVIKQTILIFFSEILNLEGHQNCWTGSKVMAILLNGWILPPGGASSGRVCADSLRSSSVSQNTNIRAYKPQLLVSLRFNKINNLN